MAHVKVSARFTLKDPPEGHLGLRGENWQFGERPMTLDELIVGITLKLSDFYAIAMRDITTEGLNVAIQKASGRIAKIEFEEL